jgi:1A family penicillin-binding protein
MDALIIKILAVGLTLSQVFTKPIEQFKTKFDAQADQAEIEQTLHSGCQFITKEFGAEQVNFEFLFSMMISNVKNAQAKNAAAGVIAPAPPANDFTNKSLIDTLDVEGLFAAYKQFCKGEKVENSPLKMNEVIDYYNKAMADLPDPAKLKGLKLPESTLILDKNGERFTEVYADNNRRKWVAMSEIPDYVKKAFVAAEDKRFYQHNGIDVRGIIRAFANTISSQARPQGGSTITQQVVKNLLVGDDLTFERKMREMVLAVKVEKLLSKDEILELYLNFVFLGRASWGVDMAARSYFGQSVRQIDLAQAAFLAALTRGPNYYHPELHPDRLQERREYVLSRMKEDGYVQEADFKKAVDERATLAPFEPPHARAAYYFLDEIIRDARRQAGLQSLTAASYTVKSTIDRELQKVTEKALQEGLANYEIMSGRLGPFEREGTLTSEIEKSHSTWQEALQKTKPKLFDVQWTLATVLDLGKNRGQKSTRKSGLMVGLPDGRSVPLSNVSPQIRQKLQVYDLLYVSLDGEGKSEYASLRLRPQVQGAVVVLEAKTGRVLAMAGGFSYVLSQLNRVTRTARQPGSTLKPFIYLSALALNQGFQPNTLIPNKPIRLPPIDRGGHAWTPKNADGGGNGVVTIRQAIEKSLNLPTVRLMASLGETPSEGLDYIRAVTQELGIYKDTVRVYPFVLGAQPARLLNVAVAYATIANIGLQPTPHFIDSIEQNGQLIYERPRFNLKPLPSLDRVSFYQIRHILEGTVERGTAKAIKDLSGFVAGKTGTSNSANDAWFVGFTNDLVVATWVGYDSTKIRPSLGSSFTGARVALPIAETVLRASFDIYKPKEPLQGPPPEIASQIVEQPIDVTSGRIGAGEYPEAFRADNPNYGADGRERILGPTALNYGLSDDAALDTQEDMIMDYDDTGILAASERDAYVETDDTPAYDPGAEDLFDLWRKKPRKIDDAFLKLQSPQGE